MSSLNRRKFLKSTLANLVHVAGSVTLASVAVALMPSPEAQRGGDHPGRAGADLEQRADELARDYYQRIPDEAAGDQVDGEADDRPGGCRFRNGGWGNGRFGPAGPRSRPGPWRNGGWLNGGSRNSAFLNGGWPNRPWSNFPWRNGNWLNAGFRY